MTRLQQADVAFIKGIGFDGKVKGYAVIYKGEEIASGTAKEVRETLRDVWKVSGDELLKILDNLSCYSKKYPVNKLKPLVKASSAFQEFGQIGKKLINTVDNEVENLFTKFDLEDIEDRVMISGMIYKKDTQNRVFMETNFTREQVANGKGALFQQFKESLHPTLLNRFNKHILKVRAKNVLASESDVLRAGRAGSHGEIRALNDLLWEIDPKGLLGEQIFNDIVGYNRFLRNGADAIQPPCVHCYYLTSGITFIGF